jgi:hypothetical protein
MTRLYPILSAGCGVLRCVRALAATVLLLLAAAAPAQAAVSMDALKPCYVSDGDAPEKREKIVVHATGFTPLAALTLAIDGAPVATGMADAFGVANAEVPAPFQGRGERPFTLSVVENLNPVNLAVATSRVTNLGVTLRPNPARAARRVRFSGRGFTNDAPVFGHYVFGGKLRKTVRFVRRSTLPCGVFHARRKQIPIRRPATGDWLLQVDQQRRYAKQPVTSNLQRVIIRVRETFKEP